MATNRRRNNNRNGKMCYFNDEMKEYFQEKTKQWLYAALECHAPVDHLFFECLEYAQGGLGEFIHQVQSLIQKTDAKYMNCPTFNKTQMLNHLKSATTRRFAADLECVWEDSMSFQPIYKEFILKYLSSTKSKTIPQKIKQIRKNLSTYLGCSVHMIYLLEFAYAVATIAPVQSYLGDPIVSYVQSNPAILANILHIPTASLEKTITEAYKSGFLDADMSGFLCLTPLIKQFWQEPDVEKLEEMLYVQIKGKTLPLEDYQLPATTVSYVTELLFAKTDEPMHILLYGPAGTGKTSFAHSLVSTLMVKAWAVASGVDDGESGRRIALVSCAHMASKTNGAIVVVDEAERLLDTNFFGFQTTKDKAWLNAFLEQKGRRTIWITNDIKHIDPAVRRRFAYSIHFEELTKEQRQNAWTQIIKTQRVASRISHKDIELLVQKYVVPAAVITKAIQHAKILKKAKKDFVSSIEHSLDAHLTLQNNGEKQKKIAIDTNGYTLDGVTLEQDREHNITSIMQKLHKIDDIMRQGKLPKGGGTMLFYGPPGTGKSALAKYMAQELGRECVIKKASDLLSMWVGGSEQNIAAAFESAERNGDILVIDEADSFIYSRESATRSWEVTQVNEFLTQLEEFRGICVCTSNRRTSMDMAAMRRFSFKIPFAYAGKEQLEKLYMSILAPSCKQELTSKELNALLACTQLTPGDFAAVRSQFWLDDDISHATLIQALMREQKDKLDNVGKMLGFR